MSLAGLLDAPFFTGSSRSVEVPGRFHCSLNGRPYMIDTSRMDDFRRQAIPLLRQQADNASAPGEQTLSPEELWRRSQDSFDHGAGQTYLDRPDSDNRRFRSSKGIDVWERWAMQLLPACTSKLSSANTNLLLQAVGTYLYALDGTALKRTADISGVPVWTTITGTPGPAATAITSDGFNVWTAHAASGVYLTTRGAATSASHNTLQASTLGYANGRLMASLLNGLYNITAAGAPPAVLWAHPNTDFTWVGFTEGKAAIYAAGFSGDKSEIYQIGIKSDGTGLNVPIVAGVLMDGEVVRSIASYVGYVLLGTDLGVRFCAMNDDGSLSIGSLIQTSSAVRCFEGQNKYVWFGWTNYDTTSTGLGRLDLQTFTYTMTPAYASDLMATGQGNVLSCVTFGNLRVFTVSGLGIFAQSATQKVASGTLDTGLITYGLPDLKTGVYLDVNVRSAVDTNRAYVSVDGSVFTLIGSRSSAAVEPFLVGQLSGETFEIRHEILNTDADLTAGPVITRYTLRAFPRPSQGEIFTVPILLKESVDTLAGAPKRYVPIDEFNAIVNLRTTKQLVTYQLASESYTVQVDDAVFLPESLTSNKQDWNGTAVLKLKAPAT